MLNPWLDISSDDYENHMKAVGQLQILQNEFKLSIEQHNPKTLIVLGAATGNGFQFINNKITQKVHAIDINPDFLKILKYRYEEAIRGLTTHICNIDESPPEISDSDLIFAALVFEYTDISRSVENVSKMIVRNGNLVAILQKNSGSDFVSKSSYKSLAKLSGFSEEVDIDNFIKMAGKSRLKLVSHSTIDVSLGKYFVKLVFVKL